MAVVITRTTQSDFNMLYTVRKVLPEEYSKYRTHLKTLSQDSKVLRFGFVIRDEVIDQICDSIEQDHKHHILFCIENSRLEFVAIGHIALTDGMELAFSVLDEYQGYGMGDALMRRCIQWCRTHGQLHGHMVCLARNFAIRHLCIKHGIRIHTEFGETQGEIELDGPKFNTYINEHVDDNLAIVDYMSKRFRFPWSFNPQNT
jgi:GNAT superfamily N-acetyltransferase